MTTVTYREAVARGIAQEMRRDDRVVFLGEDIAAAGGVFKATVGLLEEFGPQRVRDTPISEQAILGAAMGAAMTGLRPIAEIMFSDFFAVCWDLVANTGRLFTVEENPRLCGWGAEIVSIVAEEAYGALTGPPVRITTPHVPLPAADKLEDYVLPSADKITETVRKSLEER